MATKVLRIVWNGLMVLQNGTCNMKVVFLIEIARQDPSVRLNVSFFEIYMYIDRSHPFLVSISPFMQMRYWPVQSNCFSFSPNYLWYFHGDIPALQIMVIEWYRLGYIPLCYILVI